MRCSVCGKSEEEANLYEGISGGKIVDVCKECAQIEEIPLIKKPTAEQLMTADQKFSVRERMEMISEKQKSPLSKDQSIARKNIEKLNLPAVKKQEPENLVRNYYWLLKIARRKKKLTVEKLSQDIGIPAEILKSVEEGQLPKNFEPIIKTLESFFGLKLLEEHGVRPKFFVIKTPEQKEKEILEKTKHAIEHREVNIEKQLEEVQERERPFSAIIEPKTKVEKIVEEAPAEDPDQPLRLRLEGKGREKSKMLNQIQKGKFDFSKRGNLDNITLSDLADLKKEKEKQEMLGSDVELDE